MVFSDPYFIVVFLPVTLIMFHLARLYGNGTLAVVVLAVASLFFYAYWSIVFMFVLLGQVVVNYFLARRISLERRSQTISGDEQRRSYTLTLAVIFNLALLGYFKYRNFFLENVEAVFGVHFYLSALVVPLAISFHTFQQIALLVDVRDEEADVPPFIDYVLFVVFFPQLIAGPIVLHREMAKQVSDVRLERGIGFRLLGAGLYLFVFGLFKKVCIADSISTYADTAFKVGQPLEFLEAWAGAVSYALQLYFDFSGYSDMAIGLGCVFGFKLPNNFLVPFRATSMIDYWKRWHITMTRFFTMYTYMPVALSALRYAAAKGFGRTGEFVLAVAIPTFITFLLSGLWHGAGWNFIFFGLANGIGLIINHIWIAAKLPALPRVVGWLLTMTNVLVTLVFFRAASLAQAFHILHLMFLPERILVVPSWARAFVHNPAIPTEPFLLLADPTKSLYLSLMIVTFGPLALLMPALSAEPGKLVPTWAAGFSMAAMGWLVLGFIGQPHSFLYFAF